MSFTYAVACVRMWCRSLPMLMKVKSLSRNSRHAAGAEQEEPEDHVVAFGGGAQLVGGRLQFRRSVHVRELVLFVESHRHAQIVLAEEENVDARNGGDLVDVLDAGRGLHLQRHDRVAVGRAGVSQQSGLVHAALREVDRARAGGGIAAATHRLASLLGGVDVGHQHAIGAHVERLLDAAAVVIAGDAHHRLRAAVGNARQHRRQVPDCP